jgi:hypothetical protein
MRIQRRDGMQVSGWRWVGALLPALGLWVIATPGSLDAQAQESHWQPMPVPAITAMQYPARQTTRRESPLAAERAAIRAAVRRSHWREGAIVGAVLVGAAGAVVGAGICGAAEHSSCTGDILGGGLLGAAVGGVAGGLIGAQIGKGPAPGE